MTADYPFRSQAARCEFEAYSRERERDWPVPFETAFVDTPSGRTFVRVCGRPAVPPLVLLPGARISSLMWIDTVAALSAGHRIYALDVIGDAGFSVNHRAVVRPEDYVVWLDEVLSVLLPQARPGLAGVSLGGSIAAQYALRFPERVRSVVLLAPAGTVLRFSLGFFVRISLLSLPIRALGPTPLRRTCGWLFEDALGGDEACRARAERAIAELQRVVRLFSVRPPPWPSVLTDEEWREFRVPCLFLVGEHEKIYPAAKATRRLRRVAPQVETEIIPGAGHDLTMVHPDLVAEKMVRFLDRHSGAGAVS